MGDGVISNHENNKVVTTEADALLASLTEARTRAASQRAVAERLLDEARALEVRLETEAEHATLAFAKIQELASALETARALESETEALLRERREARERIEAELASAREVARLSAEKIGISDDSEAARRIAERRAADAQRAKAPQ
ncbi:MAG: hypothetical protein NVS2B17_22270 [Candidatus Velthaea sp.]